MAVANQIDQYEILEVIGRGGMGIVLRAHDTVLHRTVAVKVLGSMLAGNEEGHQRFIREARSAAALNHPNIVSVYGFGGLDNDPYLVMEYVDGISLHEYLLDSGPLPAEEIARIGIQIADGLAAAHAKGLVHRDIKPGNILIENNTQQVKLTDFGLARAVDDGTLSRTGDICGTAHYIAPETARGNKVDHRADLFSLGTVLYQMCTGELPFEAPETMAILLKVCEETPKDVREHQPDVPAWLAGLISRLHAKNPDERIQSAEEVLHILRTREIPQTLTRKLAPTEIIHRAEERPVISKKAAMIAAVAACLVFVSAVPVFYFLNSPSLPQQRSQATAPDDPQQTDDAKRFEVGETTGSNNGGNAFSQPIPQSEPAKGEVAKIIKGVVKVSATHHLCIGFVADKGLLLHHTQSNTCFPHHGKDIDLPAGDYKIANPGFPPGFEVYPQAFRVTANGEMTVHVHFDHPGGFGSPKGKKGKPPSPFGPKKGKKH